MTVRGPITSSDELRAWIRELAVDEPDPARVTHKVLTSLSPDEAQVVVTITLAEYVRRCINVAYSPLSREYETEAGERTTSSKIKRARDWVAAELRRSIYIRATDEWKHLADCSADEVRQAAEQRRVKALMTVAEAERLDKLANSMDKAEAETVSDLDRQILEAVLRR